MSCEEKRLIVDLILAEQDGGKMTNKLKVAKEHLKNCFDCREQYLNKYRVLQQNKEEVTFKETNKNILRWFVDEVKHTSKKCVKCGSYLDLAFKFCAKCAFPSPFFNNEEFSFEEWKQVEHDCMSGHTNGWIQYLQNDGDSVVENFCPYCGKSLEKFKEK